MNEPCIFQVVRVSGTIRKAEEEVIRRAKDEMRRARQEAGLEVKDTDLRVLGLKVDSQTRRTRGPDDDDEVQGIEDEDVDMDDEEEDHEVAGS